MNLELACLDRDINNIWKRLVSNRLLYRLDFEEEGFEDRCVVIPAHWSLDIDITSKGIIYKFDGECYLEVPSTDAILLLVDGVIVVVYAEEYEPISFYFFTEEKRIHHEI